MFKKIFLLAGVFFAAFSWAQNTRFIYQVTMKANAKDPSKITTELVNLDVSPEKSIFYSQKRMQRDSIFTRMIQTQGGMNVTPQMREQFRTNVNYTIEKDRSNNRVSYSSNIMRDLYSYEETAPLNWKILPETAKIGEYKTQKATTDFGGRSWTAWFTTDVPVMDGPYKFSGLPGLIVKIEDAKGDYSFDLKETKKIENIYTPIQRGQPVKVTKENFRKQQENYYRDPTAAFQQMGIRATNRQGGNIANDPEFRQRILDRAKQEQENNSNPIELK